MQSTSWSSETAGSPGSCSSRPSWRRSASSPEAGRSAPAPGGRSRVPPVGCRAMADPASKAVSDANGAEQADSPAAYGADYYRHYWGAEGPYERNDTWMAFFGHVAKRVAEELQPSSVLDAGCAMGLLVEELRKRGIDAWGVDISEYAIAQVDES